MIYYIYKRVNLSVMIIFVMSIPFNLNSIKFILIKVQEIMKGLESTFIVPFHFMNLWLFCLVLTLNYLQ